ncbi:MAG: RNA-binding domain-containing protein [Nanoarchaeota archaeon]
MDKEELSELIKTGEGLTLEFKENVSSHLGREICAFANSKGGRVILGVKDNGDILGIKITNSLKSQIQNFARNIDPAFSVGIDEVENVLIISVPEGKKKPYSVNGQFFLRIGANCQQLNRDEVREFFQKENLILFDNQQNTGFDIEKDFDEYKFKSFLRLAKITDNLNKKEILRNLFLLDGEYLKNAGVLFFCHRVTKFFMGATIACVLYQGTNKTNILDKKEFNADVLSNYDNALLYTISKLNTNYIIKRERTEKLELPEEALREAIINSTVHRDYFSTGHIQIDIFLDRVEISNPGGLVKGLSKKDFGKVSLPRNPLIMDLMLRVNKVEKVGSGIGRIQDSMRAYGLGVEFKSTGFFTVIFKRPAAPQESTRKVPEKYQKILDELVAKPDISRIELAEKLNEEPTTIQSKLRKLVKGGLIRRIGPDKGGSWEVLK